MNTNFHFIYAFRQHKNKYKRANSATKYNQDWLSKYPQTAVRVHEKFLNVHRFFLPRFSFYYYYL